MSNCDISIFLMDTGKTTTKQIQYTEATKKTPAFFIFSFRLKITSVLNLQANSVSEWMYVENKI